METIVIVASCESYRTGDFIRAARHQRLDVVIASDAESPFDKDADRTVLVDLSDADAAGAVIADTVPQAAAVIAVDDQGVVAAAQASRNLGLPTNPVSAVEATRNKLIMRRLLADAGVQQPAFAEVVHGSHDPRSVPFAYPRVVKPTGLSASRGVIRVDSHDEFVATEARIRRMLADDGMDATAPLIVEEYIPGGEIVVEGIMIDGDLEVLAVIDKPQPLTGPYFEETAFVTPSRASDATQRRAIGVVRAGVAALGIVTGPVHAELRIDPKDRTWLIEIAARSIGGLCGRSLSFGLLAEPLESVIIRSAIGRSAPPGSQTRPSSGVMMLPIPAAGTLTAVDSLEAARAVGGVDGIDITIPLGRRVVPLPEGDRYLGFIFASGATPDDVEQSLAEASRVLDITIDGESM